MKKEEIQKSLQWAIKLAVRDLASGGNERVKKEIYNLKNLDYLRAILRNMNDHDIRAFVYRAGSPEDLTVDEFATEVRDAAQTTLEHDYRYQIGFEEPT